MAALLLLGALGASQRAGAAEAPPPDDVEDAIVVRARRLDQPLLRAPGAIGVVEGESVQRGRQQLALDESLSALPGVFLQNRYNFAQDLRISLRGFGVRANFGVRGIKLLVDGIPATLPDGQGQLDAIDLGAVERIEVLPGPSSSLYGQAAGGVVSIVGEDGPPDPTLSARFAGGAHGFRSYQMKFGGEHGSLDYFTHFSRLVLDGFRDHSRTENLLFNTKLRYAPDAGSEVTAIFHLVHSPRADDPGALTAGEVDDDRRQASPRNLLFDAGESVDQQQLGLVYRRSFGGSHEIAVRNYYTFRDFENRLPFQDGGSVQLDRFVPGGGADYTWRGEVFGLRQRLLAGFDVDAQLDERERRDNEAGARGPLVFDQSEDVVGIGVYVQDQLDLGRGFELTAGLRWDRVAFDVDDHYLADGDQSGDLAFRAWSPMLALVWGARAAWNPYLLFSTSFETPTTTELARPSGEGGFNDDLEAQKALNFELGMRGLLPWGLRYQLAAFHIRLRDELVPFEVPGQPGRDFFVNSGRSTRTGIEFSLAAEPLEGLELSVAYTWSRFRFRDFDTPEGSFDGERLPGVPAHLLHAAAGWEHPRGFWIAWDLLFVGRFYADNANDVSTDAYAVSNLRAGWDWKFGRWTLGPFVGLNNLTDAEYDANVRLNASFGRFFEPAPGFHAYAGVSLSHRF
jgi:iron complex outermembrane receptor protein